MIVTVKLENKNWHEDVRKLNAPHESWGSILYKPYSYSHLQEWFGLYPSNLTFLGLQTQVTTANRAQLPLSTYFLFMFFVLVVSCVMHNAY